jgi:hypothetical protein
MRKQKDDTKQCTLSFGGGVLSPSAATLHDSKQPRITKMMVGDSGKASRHFLSHSAHAKEDAPDGLERQVSRVGSPAAPACARVRARIP